MNHSKKHTGDIIPAIVTILIGVFAMVYIHSQKKLTLLDSSAAGVLGPGFYPFVCGGLLVLFGLLLLIRGILQHGLKDYFQLTPEKKKNLTTMLLLALSVAAFLAAWQITDQFFICLFVYAIIVNLLLKRSWLFTILFAVIVTAFVYFLFAKGFSVIF